MARALARTVAVKVPRSSSWSAERFSEEEDKIREAIEEAKKREPSLE